MKTLLLIFLLMVACRPGLALQLNQDVSSEGAKELGVTIHSDMNEGNGVKAEFVPAGTEKLYARGLEIDVDGKWLVAAS